MGTTYYFYYYFPRINGIYDGYGSAVVIMDADGANLDILVYYYRGKFYGT